VQVIGHRGAAALAPENTWDGFDLALELGVDAIETDVRSTSDGELVLIHDERLDRTTNGTGPVRDTPWPTVAALDAGSWFGDLYRDARVPLLRETLRRYGRRTHLVLEVKQAGIELEVLQAVEDLALLERVTFTSFLYDVVRQIKEASESARVGYLAADVGPSIVKSVVHAGFEQFCPPAEVLTPEAVNAWKARGLEVRAWGVRDVGLMQRAIGAGVDGMTVDFPHLLLQALGR
jgi:glycerophosphoryl diester phosphodiesterase